MSFFFGDEPALVERIHVHRRRGLRGQLARQDLDQVLGLVLDPERHAAVAAVADLRGTVGDEDLVVVADIVDVAVRLHVLGIDRERSLPRQERPVEITCTIPVQAILDQTLDVDRYGHVVVLTDHPRVLDTTPRNILSVRLSASVASDSAVRSFAVIDCLVRSTTARAFFTAS